MMTLILCDINPLAPPILFFIIQNLKTNILFWFSHSQNAKKKQQYSLKLNSQTYTTQLTLSIKLIIK